MNKDWEKSMVSTSTKTKIAKLGLCVLLSRKTARKETRTR